MEWIFVYNQSSGGALSPKELRKLCASANIHVSKFLTLDDTLERKLTPYIEKNATVAVVGGDGTISAVASLLVNTKATLVPLPGGTLNHFTKDLGIAQDLEAAIRDAARAPVRRIDIARVNNTIFINNSSLGLYPSSLRERGRLENVLGKWIAACVGALRSLVRFRTYTVEIAGETFTTPFVFVGNNRYYLDEPGIAVRKRLNEGVLSVYIARTASRVALLKIAGMALIGKAHYLDEFDIHYVHSLTIKNRHKRLFIAKDGEVCEETTPLHYSIDKKVLAIR